MCENINNDIMCKEDSGGWKKENHERVEDVIALVVEAWLIRLSSEEQVGKVIGKINDANEMLAKVKKEDDHKERE